MGFRGLLLDRVLAELCARLVPGVAMLKCRGPSALSRFDRAFASSMASSGPAPSCGPFDGFRDPFREAAGVDGLGGFDAFRDAARDGGFDGDFGGSGFGGPGEGSSFGGGSVGFGGFFGFLGFLVTDRPREEDDDDCARTLFSSASTSSSLGFGGSLCSEGTISMLVPRVFFADAERGRGALASLFCAGAGAGSG